jgi:hypothetical protein
MFAPEQLLRNWREQWHSSKRDLELSVMGEASLLHGANLLLISFLYVIVVGLHFEWYTLHFASLLDRRPSAIQTGRRNLVQVVPGA